MQEVDYNNRPNECLVGFLGIELYHWNCAAKAPLVTLLQPLKPFM